MTQRRPEVRLAQRARIAWYRRHWSCARVQGRPLLWAPAVLAGDGLIGFEGVVTLGWPGGPGFLAGYSYIEARAAYSSITFGDGTHLNNGVCLVSDGPGIALGKRCLVGPGVHVYDSDFHPLSAAARGTEHARSAAVDIGDDVFVGTGAIILRGVTIGGGSVIGAGAVVIADVAPHTVVAGNPARTVRDSTSG
jgi:maltose O-acetyltransferase